jgi:hypothetical protein
MFKTPPLRGFAPWDMTADRFSQKDAFCSEPAAAERY